MLSRIKYPIEYELEPAAIDKGSSWVTLKLKNIGNETFNKLDVQLHSMDTDSLSVMGSWLLGTGQYVEELRPNNEAKVVFRVNATGSVDAYAAVKGRKDGEYFWWESGLIHIYVSDEKAYLESLLVLSNPYTSIGKTISAEATVKGLRKNGGLKLEFWVETPSGKNEKQAAIEIKDLPVGEEARYTAEFTTKETGRYSVYAYLFDEWRRIDHKMDFIFATKQ
ncbi:MAG TPA: hypothetical protein VK209_10370 [Candidatus Sulfotelmatobacter sp.]|nr:hypothetical protein [Candidatus Sulfotelmatobacter sp.]